MKRVNGTGSIAHLSDGRYCVTYTDLTGKRIYRYRRKREDAERELAALITHNGTATVPESTPLLATHTLDSWASLWLASNEGRLRHSTCKTYRRQLGRVTETLGSVNLAGLSPVILSQTLTTLRQRGTGARQLQQIYTVLRTCLEAATKMDIIATNPMRKVDKPRWEAVKREYWDVAQTRRFVAVALASDRRYAPLMALLATTGLRISEALGLEWRDVDMGHGTLSINRALVWVYQEWRMEPPKTKSALRRITLPSQAVAALRRYAALTGEPTAGAIFRRVTGNPPSNSTLRGVLIDLCNEAGVPVINIHGLRHVAATMALRATRDVHAVQRRLGHANVAVTMGIYAYALVEDGEAAAAIDRMMDAKPEPKPMEAKGTTKSKGKRKVAV